MPDRGGQDDHAPTHVHSTCSWQPPVGTLEAAETAAFPGVGMTSARAGGVYPPMPPGRLLATAPAALCLALGLALAGPGGLALAHDGLPPEPHDLWTSWSRDPLV